MKKGILNHVGANKNYLPNKVTWGTPASENIFPTSSEWQALVTTN